MFEKNYLLGIQDLETTACRDAMHRQSFPEPTVMSRQQDEGQDTTILEEELRQAKQEKVWNLDRGC